MKKILKSGVMSLLFLVFLTRPALAEEPVLVSGTLNLLNQMLTWILYLIPIGASTMMAWHAFSKAMNEGDPAKVQMHNQSMKNILIAAAIGMTAAGTVKAILSFYGGGN